MQRNLQRGNDAKTRKKQTDMKRLQTIILSCLLFTGMATAQEDRMFETAKSLDLFNSAFRELEMFYVDTLDAKRCMEIALDAMLYDLDPYTEYYAEEDLKDLKMMTTGKYGGMGSIIRMRKDSTVMIAEPYKDMPAAEVGLKVGDVLLNIDGHDLKGKAVSDVSEMLRGEPGTTFVVRIQRPGEKKPRDFRITRRVITMPAVPYSGLLSGNSSIAYINLSQFTEGCAKEMRKAIISLKEKGAISLIIDLRGNGGGLLNEAVDIVNLFVPKDINIVETKGKVKSACRTYKTTSEPIDLNIPITVLVDGNTASAAEIVSGSLQDLDRAVVIGTRTFGKGLVQSTRELNFNSSIKLTTAKYYIPSGRCIQAIDYKERRTNKKNGQTTKEDSVFNIFHTANGREVRDGKGILPDVELKHDTLANMLFYLSNDDALVDWGTEYMRSHPNLPDVNEFEITNADMDDLLQMMTKTNFKYDRISEKKFQELVKSAKFEGYYDESRAEFDALEKCLSHNLERDFNINRKEIRKLMANEVVKRYAYQAGVIQFAIRNDQDVDKAVEILNNQQEYKRILKPADK